MRLGIICVRFRKVAPKKTRETDAIFEQLEGVRKTVQQDVTVLRFSLDAKATVLLGNYSRGGQNRIVVKAADHDFQAKQKVTPYCIFLPDYNRAFLYFTASRVTSDFIVDCLLDCWQQICQDFPTVKTLLLLQDNGPENHSRRTQFMQRIVQLAGEHPSHIVLPAIHKKKEEVGELFHKHLGTPAGMNDPKMLAVD